MNDCAKKPNILLITTDQQRFDTVGERSPSFMRTPHFDHLTREGITFSNAYSDCPICVPSRISIMTGKFSKTHGMMHNGETTEVMGRDETLPSRMRALGYQTAAVGKMHFGPQRTRHGFDEMLIPADYYKQFAGKFGDLAPMRHGLGQNELYPTMSTVPESMTLTSWTAEKCVEYIRDRRDPTQPFFLWCSFSKPHPPLDPPEPYYSMYRNSPIPEPVFGDWSEDDKCPQAFKRFRQSWSLDLLPPEIIKEARAAYYGLITQIDYNMGRVFAALQDLGMFEDTLVIFTSDHGEFLGDHHTGCKIFPHEPSAHVPFVMRLPKSWKDRRHGTTAQMPVTHADIMPTLLNVAGGKAQTGTDGIDILSAVRDQPDRHRFIQIQTSTKSEKNPKEDLRYLALTDGGWKYVWFPEGGYEQLFDLTSDPKELKNLAGSADYEEKRKELYEELVKRNSGWKTAVDGDKLVQRSVEEDLRDIRNNAWPGYHTENVELDVKH